MGDPTKQKDTAKTRVVQPRRGSLSQSPTSTGPQTKRTATKKNKTTANIGAMASAKTKNCTSCDSPDSEDDMIACDFCVNWYHGKCEDIAPAALTYFKDSDHTYKCIDCRKNKNLSESDNLKNYLDGKFKDADAKIDDKFKDVDANFTVIKDGISELKTEMDETKKRITDIENKYHFASKNEFEAAIQAHTDQVATEIRSEIQERHIRRKRIMISKIPDDVDPTENEAFVRDLADTAKIDTTNVSFSNIFRVNRKKGTQLPDGRDIPGKPFSFSQPKFSNYNFQS